ncbi:hypothetical protein [Thioalkalivibrio sp. XN8]|uniref:hypothetical protein n=1 Tax=Thioalkalivibrio sp. XN8 TaxID=2712863 RepID=UPI0013EB64C1|nr:hypothetical protein [Thioalkalivibrio sp. XN8]NGP54435.1 hypothetical protein [Thioalkalivibrio sp. XN8]
MSEKNTHGAGPARPASLVALLLGCAMLGATGCDGRSANDGTNINQILLPSDTLLNLACAEVGIGPETCVLADPENPFATVPVPEFDVNNPEGETKFDLADDIPAGPTGAKARFYLWATALARRPSGENQWLTARALHELYDANSDPLIRDQALKAYRSVLDNFFGSVTFFECCGGVSFPGTLNERVADDLYRTEATGYERLVPGDPVNVLSLFGEWGYTYRPANPPNYDDGLVTINRG